MANINIGGRLHSTASGNVVAGANEILDDSKGKKQSVINAETDSALTGKQETISDLSTIRSGAAAGATAYQKPSGGIPASDIASGVIPAISTNIGTDASSDTKAASPKAVKTYVDNEDFETPLTPDGTVIITLSNGDKKTISFNHNHPNYFDKLVGSSIPSGGLVPDTAYKLGTLTGAVTIDLAPAVTGCLNHYFFTFSTSSTAPTITWPASVTKWNGNCVTSNAPVISASKHYEVSILDGVGVIYES